MNSEMMEALYTIEREKGISVEIMLEALANALVTAYKRMPDAAEEALVEIDIETGQINVIAQELDEDGHVVKEWDDTPEDFGRIAAQTAKQVMMQRIREDSNGLRGLLASPTPVLEGVQQELKLMNGALSAVPAMAMQMEFMNRNMASMSHSMGSTMGRMGSWLP